MCWWGDASCLACGLVMWELQQQCQYGILLIRGPGVDPFPGGNGKCLSPQQRGSAKVGKSSSLLITLETKSSQEERGREVGVQRSPKCCVRVEDKVWEHHPSSFFPECRLRKVGDTWMGPQSEKHQLFMCRYCRLWVLGRQRIFAVLQGQV